MFYFIYTGGTGECFRDLHYTGAAESGVGRAMGMEGEGEGQREGESEGGKRIERS